MASHFKHIIYSKTKKKYHCAILIPEGSPLITIYKEEPYEFITYNDLYQRINSLDKEQYDLVLILSDTACALSPRLMDKIYDAYDSGIQAIQLHSITENRQGFRNRFRILCDEIKTVFAGQETLSLDCHPIYSEPIWLLIWNGCKRI